MCAGLASIGGSATGQVGVLCSRLGVRSRRGWERWGQAGVGQARGRRPRSTRRLLLAPRLILPCLAVGGGSGAAISCEMGSSPSDSTTCELSC